MFIGECVTGTSLEVALEPLRLLEAFKGDVKLELPRPMLAGMRAFASIVLGHPGFEVSRMTGVAFHGISTTFQNVSVKHAE